MKKASGNKIRLGIFVSIGFALLIACIYLIGERQQLFSNTFQVSGIFKNISGLQIGNNVRFSGINVGIVDNIEQLTDTTVKVDMMINDDTRKFMKKNAKAIIGSDGLMGNKIVIITPGTNGQKTLADNDVIATEQPVTMDDILIKLKVTGDNAATITSDLAVVMTNIREGKGTIGKLLMDTAMAKEVDQALTNIKQGAGGFKQNMNAASNNVLLRGYFKKKKKADEKDKK
ncbi:MAG: MCE family protein [Sphingobacteriaceae bacterium]|nr:MCE family protein [Sphingobacteriaceae bacterium]